jgi:hypothetical protein
VLASPASVLFVIGSQAAEAMELLDDQLPASELAADIKQDRPGKVVEAEVGGRHRHLIYVPHPTWLRLNSARRARFELPGLVSDETLTALATAVPQPL